MKKIFSGLFAGGKAYFVLENHDAYKNTLVIAGEDEINLWFNNLTALGKFYYNPKIYSFLTTDNFNRIETLNNLKNSSSSIILATESSVKEKTFSAGSFQKNILKLSSESRFNLENLTKNLIDFGFTHDEFVEEKGQFSRRGEILDVWPVDQNVPWRLVFNNDTLESIRSFDVDSQRSSRFFNKIEILPVKEIPEGYLSEYLSEETKVYFDIKPDPELEKIFEGYDCFINEPLSKDAEDAGFKALLKYEGKIPLFIDEFKKFAGSGYKTAIFCPHQGEKERIEEILFENKLLDFVSEINIGPLEEGFYSDKRRLAVFSSQEILYKRKPVSFPKFKTGRRLEGLWEISSGDYVVHERYGIGRYLGLKKIARGQQEQEYLCIEYKGGDKLYIPIYDFKVVQKYVGLEGYRPKLHSLDTVAWERAKQRAKESAIELAQDLLKLYAERQKSEGVAYPRDIPWEMELSDSFPYSETEDQLKAIEEVKADLSKSQPMERLVCGDVGYGKTEVAIRAAFKVVLSSKQVAVLVPTTVLAEQHFQTFTQRLSPFPVKIEVLSRFQSKLEQTKAIENIKAGSVDIVIGTHRLLQKDIEFHDLGLLIIDEEHRFGVKQKEKIKSMKKNVDVLLLSATPIPRTLSLALSNIRDLSVIETPPYGRLPIETHLGHYDEKLIQKIIRAELSRGGQVFYVHNRVETILTKAEQIKKLIPESKLGIVHGQLSGPEIEKAMWRFLHKEIDVLLATTIIESGLDIPSVNTMIVEDAENFGLSQLYQLRGRIGRSSQKAYCYLFSSSSSLTEDARKRLEALNELSELGSGFRLALRDLEIRGGGNVLGAEQHGFVREVGFELYSRLIAEASRNLKGEVALPKENEESKTVVDFDIPAYIPESYIASDDLRIIFYRRLVNAGSNEDLSGIREEFLDRFGKLPVPLENLFRLTGLRLTAQKSNVKSIIEKEKFYEIYFLEDISVKPENIVQLAQDYKDILEFIRGESKGIRLIKKLIRAEPVDYLKAFLSNLHKYVKINQK
ncbi:MAG: transcription-repair coupling factor [Elusimicrobia bacterium]|nr:transcription-repair coupling factor [Candidatus Liberimonas magnetica]